MSFGQRLAAGSFRGGFEQDVSGPGRCLPAPGFVEDFPLFLGQPNPQLGRPVFLVSASPGKD